MLLACVFLIIQYWFEFLIVLLASFFMGNDSICSQGKLSQKNRKYFLHQSERNFFTGKAVFIKKIIKEIKRY